MKSLFVNLHNAIDYPLRRFFHWQRGGLRVKNQDKEPLFADLPPGESEKTRSRAQDMVRQYHLEAFHARSTRKVYRINLHYLDLLEQACQQTGYSLPARVQTLDIGCSDWFYVQALYQWLRWWENPAGTEVSLVGYEADAYRVYRDLHSCLDYARWYSRGLEGVSYIPEPFTGCQQQADLVFMFFPFVFLIDHQDWGLPNRMYFPNQLLQMAWDSLKPGGMLLIANQGKEEHQAQINLLETISAPIKAAFMFQSPFMYYEQEHYVITAIR